MNQRFIVIDGKKYNSVEEMPPDVRKKYEEAMSQLQGGNVMDVFADKNKNGMPDVFENMPVTTMVSSSMNFIVDGKTYNRIEDLPPEARAKYEQAMGSLDKNKNGMPDILEGIMKMPDQIPSTQNFPVTTSPRSSTPIPASSTITPDTSNGWMLALVGVLSFSYASPARLVFGISLFDKMTIIGSAMMIVIFIISV